VLYSVLMLTGAPLRAVLFDVGGTLVDETGDYVFSLQVVKDVLTRELGREVSEEEIESARDRAISAWAPSFTKAVLWHFLSPDIERTKAVYEEVVSRIFAHREEVTLMDGVIEIVPKLARRYKLAIAGNQPLEMLERLRKTGLLEHFAAVVLSSEIHFHKPDSRFFLAVCERISVSPENCCMVGDRLDNDIYPANVLDTSMSLVCARS